MKPTPLYLFGKHAAQTALENPMRKVKRILVTSNTRKEMGDKLFADRKNLSLTEGHKLDAMLPAGSVHQGIVLEVEPLATPSLQDWLAEGKNQPVLLLDQVSDPHNVGAILRSAAAFDVGAVIVTERNAPAETGVMAKSASGALESVPLIHVPNLVQAIELVKKAGYWIVGLDGGAKENLSKMKLDAKTGLVLGAEGQGMRRLTVDHCDFLAKLPMSPRMESLNVSNAAAIALYEMYRMRTGI